MPKSRKSRAPAPPKRKASNSLNEFDISDSDPEIPQSPEAGTAAVDATVADSASKASSTNHDWYDEDLSESSDAGRSSPAILEDLAGSGVTNSTGDGKKYLEQNAAGHHRAKGETASKTGEARVR